LQSSHPHFGRGYNGMYGKPIFIPESVALVAFAVSWLCKGLCAQDDSERSPVAAGT